MVNKECIATILVLVVLVVAVGVLSFNLVAGAGARAGREGMLAGTVPMDSAPLSLGGRGGQPSPDPDNDSLNPEYYLAKLENKGANMCWYVDPRKLRGDGEDAEEPEDTSCAKERACGVAFHMPPPGGMPDAPRVTGHDASTALGIGALTGAGGGMLWLDRQEEADMGEGAPLKDLGLFAEAGVSGKLSPVKALTLASGGSAGHAGPGARDPRMDQTFQEWAKAAAATEAQIHGSGSGGSGGGASCYQVPFYPVSMSHCLSGTGDFQVVGVISTTSAGCNNTPNSVEIASMEQVRQAWGESAPFTKNARVRRDDHDNESIGYANMGTAGGGWTTVGSAHNMWARGRISDLATFQQCSPGAASWHHNVWVTASITKESRQLPTLNAKWQWRLGTVALIPPSGSAPN